MRFLQGSWPARLSTAASGAVISYYAAPHLAMQLGIPEELTGFMVDFFGMAVVSRAGKAVQAFPIGPLWQAVIDHVRWRRHEHVRTIYITIQAAIAVVCWLIVAGGAGLAVFSCTVHDTLLERGGLSAVSITARGTAFHIVDAGWASDGGAGLSMAMAAYVAAVAYKHVRGFNKSEIVLLEYLQRAASSCAHAYDTGRPNANRSLETLSRKQLRRDEGEVLHEYKDSLGYSTIGVGRLIDKRKGGDISEAEFAYLFGNDYASKRAELRWRVPWFDRLDTARQGVLLNMAF